MLLFIFMSIAVGGHFLPFSLWSVNLSWIAPVALVISALIAAQFGRTRLTIISLALIGLQVTWQSDLPSPVYVLPAAVMTSWFLWRPDRGLLPINVLLTLLELCVVATVIWVGLPVVSEHLEPVLSFVYPWLLQLGPEISGQLSAFESLLCLLLMLSSVSRIVLVPSNSHVALFVAICMLISLHIYPQQAFLWVGLILLAIMFVLAILIDSFNMAFRDELTGIPSRRALMQFVQTLGRKYVVVMSDIDHFKKFNDTYGHDVGDQVLKLVASKLSNVTGGGRAFRYGGEEFTLIFPRKSVHEVTAHVDMIRQLIADYPIVLRGQDRPVKPPKKPAKNRAVKHKTVRVTCSFGIAERTADTKAFSDIMKKADVALYAAKKAGRNCVKTDTP